MSIENDTTFIAILTTKGRVTGKDHSKMLKAVKHNEMIYFSRHEPNSDWFKNVMKNSEVIVEINGKKSRGIASIVNNDVLSQKISELKYPGQEKAKEKRVTIEIKLCEPQ